MNSLRIDDYPVSRHRPVSIAIAAIVVAVAFAYIAATMSFPLLMGLDRQATATAAAAIAFIVALPIVMALTLVLARVSDQKRDLAAREDLFVTAQQIGKFGYWHYDLATGQIILSDNVHDLLGDPDRRLQLSMTKLLEMTNVSDRQSLAESLRRIIVEGACEESEYRVTGLDGVEKTFWVDGRRMLDRAGNPLRAYGACQDTTEKKRAQVEVEEARSAAEQTAQQLESVLSSTTDGVLTLDRDFRITYLNRTANDLIAEGRDLVGMFADDAFPELAVSSLRYRLEEAFSRQRPMKIEEFLTPYDRWLDFYVYPSNDALSLFFRDVSERRQAQEQLLYLAHHDTLTGLVNRNVLHERLTKSLAEASLKKQTALLFLDLDEFKSVNDSLGHSVGDLLLVQVGKRLQRCVRNGDIVARFGGDEFAVLAEVNGQEEAANLAERIIGTLSRPYAIGGRTASVGVSIGIVTASSAGVATDDALRDADIALYQAKAAGRGTYRLFEAAMGETFREREVLKQDLCGAVTRNEFSIDYQPLIDLGTKRVNGLEALLRWKHPTRGLVAPGTFIPIAEECGLIGEIGEWVLVNACRDAVTWPAGVSVAVNLSPAQFRSSDLVEAVSRSLNESGLPGERLQLEITELVLLADNAANVEVLHALRKLGIAISMDDFGTGYSSLSYLRRFPLDKIKIDRAFVSDLSAEASNGEASPIARAIIDLARGFGIKTTAEGVETRSQLAALRAMGCNEVQGFLFSRPVPIQHVPETILRLNQSREAHA